MTAFNFLHSHMKMEAKYGLNDFYDKRRFGMVNSNANTPYKFFLEIHRTKFDPKYIFLINSKIFLFRLKH